MYPSNLTINRDEVHLWCARDADIQSPDLLREYHGMLSADEKSRQTRFYFQRHRHQFLVTRALIRWVLSLYHPSIAPQHWTFGQNDYGRPHIEQAAGGLNFNVSHTFGMIVMAVCRDRTVGVDVEHLKDREQLVDIAGHSFSALEYQALLALPPNDRLERFFDIWTLKESYIKACGMGLSIPLDQFSFSFPDRDHIGIRFDARRDDNSKDWRFWQFGFDATHRVAVATRDSSYAVWPIRTYGVIPAHSIRELPLAPIRWTPPPENESAIA